MNVMYALADPGSGQLEGSWAWVWLSMMVLLWIAVIGVVAWSISRAVAARTSLEAAAGPKQARDRLAERFARGEIDSEEYHARLDRLR